MSMLSDDDRDLGDLSAAELDDAWDLWFDLAQVTNDDDPPYSHGVLQTVPSDLSTDVPRATTESTGENVRTDDEGLDRSSSRRWPK